MRANAWQRQALRAGLGALLSKPILGGYLSLQKVASAKLFWSRALPGLPLCAGRRVGAAPADGRGLHGRQAALTRAALTRAAASRVHPAPPITPR